MNGNCKPYWSAVSSGKCGEDGQPTLRGVSRYVASNGLNSLLFSNHSADQTLSPLKRNDSVFSVTTSTQDSSQSSFDGQGSNFGTIHIMPHSLVTIAALRITCLVKPARSPEPTESVPSMAATIARRNCSQLRSLNCFGMHDKSGNLRNASCN